MPKFMVLMVRGMGVSLNPVEVITPDSHDTEIELNTPSNEWFSITSKDPYRSTVERYGRLCQHPADGDLLITVFDLEDIRQVELAMASLQWHTWEYSRKKIVKEITDMRATRD